MAALEDRLSAYLPRLLHDWIVEQPALAWREVEGSLALVDVSGFTQLSEQLARRGKLGAEQLTDTIGDWCARLLEVAYANGGSLVKFGGDALLLLFTDDNHTARAARAAVGMGRVLEAFGRLDTPDGPVTLRMSVGIHSGVFHFMLCGASHRELVIAGPAATETVVVESAAQAGQVMLSVAAASLLPRGCTVVPGPGIPGRLLKVEPRGSYQQVAHQPASTMANLAPYLPAGLRDHLAVDEREPEHRKVSIAFLRFRGTDEAIAERGAATTAAALDRLLTCIQQAADRHRVTFLGTDIDRDGGKVILVSGAPATAGNDEERLLLALREIVEGDLPLPVHVGVNAGRVFAGDVGFRHRRAYTVMGDAVNLAARLMASSGSGEILATSAVLDASNTAFDTVVLEPFTVKGKREPVTAAKVGRVLGTRSRGVEAGLPLLGRAAEIEVFEQVLDTARRGSGCLVEVVGEAGIGKTRLVEAFVEEAEGFDVHLVACELYRASTPYVPFRRLLRSLLDVDWDADDEDVAARLHEVLAGELPDLLPWKPLLGIPLGLELDDTTETRNLDKQFRRPRLHDVTFGLLRHLVHGPWLLAFEDAQWLDEASGDLLRSLVTRLDDEPWVICLTRRGVDPTFAGPSPSIALPLAPLDDVSTEALAVAATDEAPLPTHELAELIKRSGGNPLFLHELLAAVRAGGFAALPDTVEALVTARIDQLPHEARMLLRHVSVLGQTFQRGHVDAVAPGHVVDDERVWEQLAGFLARDSETIRFRHMLIRDAAYEGLPYRLRRQLHATTGDAIARSGGGQADLLSFHYFLAGRFPEAWRYSLVAAERASAIYANDEAARFYDRALEAAPEVSELTRSEIGRVSEALGDALQRMGDYAKAGAAYRRARRTTGADAVTAARLLLKQARVQAWLKRYSQALGLITRGLRRLEGDDSPAAGGQRAQLMVWYGHLRQEQGRHADAIEWSRRAIDAAQVTDERDVLAHAYKLLDWVYADRGEFEKATHSQRALTLYEELGDLASQAGVLNNMGGIAYWQGRWSDALDFYERASELDERTGDVVGAAFGRNNIGEILLDQGRVDEAELLFREAERVFRGAGYRSGIAFVRANLGRAAARAARFEESLELLDAGRVAWEEIGAEVQAQEAQARIAESHVLRGDAEAALELADDALGRAGSREGVAAQSPLIHRVRGYALMQRGELVEARAALDESLRSAAARQAGYEHALTQRALVQLAEMEGAPPPRDLVEESREVFERLDVVRLPEVPLAVLDGRER